MQIIGNGTINSTVSGDSTTYTAVPLNDYKFKYWSGGGINYTDNPLTLKTVVELTSVTFYYSIYNYLKGMVGFNIPDSSLISIISRRSEYLKTSIGIDDDISDISSEVKDLLYADVLIWGATGYSNYGSVSESDGGWSHQEGSSTINAADKKRFESIAKSIYDSYHDTLNIHPSIRIVSL